MRLGNAQPDGKGKYCCVDCGGRTGAAHEILRKFSQS